MKSINATLLLILFATATCMVSNSWTSLSAVNPMRSTPSSPAATPAAAKPAFGPGQAIYQVRLYYQANLRDYGSAQFDWGSFNGTELTFFINAKNGFGAFTGRRRMVAIFVNGRLNRIAG